MVEVSDGARPEEVGELKDPRSISGAVAVVESVGEALEWRQGVRCRNR